MPQNLPVPELATAQTTAVRLDAAQALMRTLRETPRSAWRDPAELAQLHGLEEHMVRHVLRGIQRVAPERTKKEARRWQVKAADIRTWLGEWFGEWVSKPVPTILYSYAASTAVVVLAAMMPAKYPVARDSLDLAATVTIFGTVALQSIIFFRQGRCRYPLISGATLATITMVNLTVTTFVEKPPIPELQPIALVGLLAFASITLGALAALVGCLVSVLGGYNAIRTEEKLETEQGRRLLVGRYLEIRERLKQAQGAPTGRFRNLRADFQRRELLFTSMIGLFVGIWLSAIHQFWPSNSVEMAEAVARALSLGAYALVGYAASSVRNAARNALVVFLIPFTFILVPTSAKWHVHLMSDAQHGETYFALISVAAVAGLSYMGGLIQERTIRQRRLRENDPAALLEELARLEWRLRAAAGTVTVLVVDAAGSTKMKVDEDPMTIEFCFRAYQDWIASVANRHEGRVHATAGDGAVVAYKSALQAYRSAQRLHTELEGFNRDVNKLKSPFRLRVGLHMGAVAGDLDKVVFSDVIDIAAHLEKVSPVGGIAMSDPVAQEILKTVPGEPFASLDSPVDGQAVKIAIRVLLEE